ncbi:unnamed protein product [Ceratitis capitata]|uniref:(Mediterranean fruit fly) hypothetical protein n=1 Tax=Ceratitis capitata TaxID=7213 RepID=A0A811UTP9_CERCA|nr:unnamed protein product [Ceratitis capitata]
MSADVDLIDVVNVISDSKKYDKNFKIDDKVFRRNFTQSDAAKKFCAELAPKFNKAKVASLKGNCMCELEDCLYRKRAIYHRKDVQEAKCWIYTSPTLYVVNNCAVNPIAFLSVTLYKTLNAAKSI